MRDRHIPWVFWPFVAVWKLLALILGLTGRLVAGILGLVFLLAGLVLVITIIGAPAGVVMIIAGFLLLVRSLF